MAGRGTTSEMAGGRGRPSEVEWRQSPDSILIGDSDDGDSDGSIEIIEVTPAPHPRPSTGYKESEQTPNSGTNKERKGGNRGHLSLDEYRCPICLDNPEMLAVVACGHAYCSECVFTALSMSNYADRRTGECSLCRKRVKYADTWFLEVRKHAKSQ